MLGLVVAYDGRAFSGAASQPGRLTVAGALEGALGTVVGLPVKAVLAGRTDAGVHARAQVVGVELDEAAVARLGPLDRLGRRLERLARVPLWVRGVGFAPAGFDPRRSARWRHYVYRLVQRPRDPLLAFGWPVGPLEVHRLASMLASLRGPIDATGLCRARADGGYAREVLSARAWVRGADEVLVSVLGVSFCHQFVRRAVGNAVAAATGRLALEDWERGVREGRRELLPYVAPPEGLALWRVGYESAWTWSEELLVERGLEADWAVLDRREGPAGWSERAG